MVKPEEMCDLQPTTECQIVTNLVPHLIRQPICEDVPKEFCHMKLDSPKLVTKPVTMKWCTFPNGEPPKRANERPNTPSAFNLQLINPPRTTRSNAAFELEQDNPQALVEEVANRDTENQTQAE